MSARFFANKLEAGSELRATPGRRPSGGSGAQVPQEPGGDTLRAVAPASSGQVRSAHRPQIVSAQGSGKGRPKSRAWWCERPQKRARRARTTGWPPSQRRKEPEPSPRSGSARRPGKDREPGGPAVGGGLVTRNELVEPWPVPRHDTVHPGVDDKRKSSSSNQELKKTPNSTAVKRGRPTAEGDHLKVRALVLEPPHFLQRLHDHVSVVLRGEKMMQENAQEPGRAINI